MKPPEIVVLFAVPPEEMYMEPLELTVVLFAVPPEEMNMEPELTVVLFATVLEWMVIAACDKLNPEIVLEAKVIFAPSATLI